MRPWLEPEPAIKTLSTKLNLGISPECEIALQECCPHDSPTLSQVAENTSSHPD